MTDAREPSERAIASSRISARLCAVARGEIGAGVAAAGGCERLEELPTPRRQLVVRDSVLRDIEPLRGRAGQRHDVLDQAKAVGRNDGNVGAERRVELATTSPAPSLSTAAIATASGRFFAISRAKPAKISAS